MMQKMTKDFLRVVSDSNFLSGECASLLSKNFKSHQSKNNEQATINMSLPTFSEEHYLKTHFKSGTHTSTKAGHIFNKLCTSDFLNVKFADFCKNTTLPTYRLWMINK